MNKDKKPDSTSLFKSAMKGVTPLKPTRVVQPYKKPPIKPKKLSYDEPQILSNPLSDPVETHYKSNDCVYFKRPGLQDKKFLKLRKGKITPEAILDIHGMTREQARYHLDTFIAECGNNGYLCALLIHGKGKQHHTPYPVLKNHTIHWLKQYPQILAFCSATTQDGGTGALYILFKHQH